MSVKGHMVPDGPCTEAYPAALDRGEVIECEKTTRHYKHANYTVEAPGSIVWWGRPLDEDDRQEADRIRALGGRDPLKILAWTQWLLHDLGVGK